MRARRTAKKQCGKGRTAQRLTKAGGVFLCFAFLAMIAGGIFRYTEIARLGREVSELDMQIEVLHARKDTLQHQLRPYTKKTHVETVARNELKMEYNEIAGDRTASHDTQLSVEPSAEVSAQNPTLFGQLSVFVFSLLYR